MILSIETATEVCSVALTDTVSGETTSSLDFFIPKIHGSHLVPAIKQLLKLSNISSSDLSAIAISKGPGSYTGLRIGTSTAKGLCYSLDIPLISINTLKGLAKQVTMLDERAKLICPMLDARRNEVYTELFNHKLDAIKPTQALILDENSFAEDLKKSEIYFFGNGANKLQKVAKNENAILINNIVPNAKTIGLLAFNKFHEKDFENLAYFEPFYLKNFIKK